MKNNYINLINISIFLIFSISSFSQTGSVRGFVYDKKNGEPIIFTNVFLQTLDKKNTNHGVPTNVDGFYHISKVPVGDYFLTVKYLGYETIEKKINIKKNTILKMELFLNKSSIKLKEFVISAEKQEMKTKIRTSVIKISPKQMEKIPSIGAEPDLAQYLQVVPGVVFTGDQGGQLYIRGGSPIQNKILLDGMIVYNPFHSIGFFSVFDADIIRNTDVYTGGFSAEYGGRISSIMDVTTRDGNKKRFAGKISMSTFGSKILLEGPIKKYKENSQSSSSYLFSLKTSYLEETSKKLYTYANEDGLPFNYTDFYGKVSINNRNGSKLNFFTYNFTDEVNYNLISNLNWNSLGFGSSLIMVPENSSALIKANFSYSKYGILLEEENGRDRSSDINGYNFNLQFIYFIGKDELSYGIETLGFKTIFDFQNSVGMKITQEENTTELAAYVKYKKTLGKLLIEPSFRFHYYASLSNYSPEPRFGLKYNITDRLRVKLSAGFYSQNLIASNSDRDVVNLFYGFLSGPENIQEEFDGEEITHKLQKSRHLIFGFEYDLTKKIDVNVEAYYKQNTQVTNINKNKLYEDNYENSHYPDHLKNDFIVEKGDAYGVDFLLKYDHNEVYFWMVYSLGFVERTVDLGGNILKYEPHFDRRHNINLVSSYVFGEGLKWEFSARWNLGSGFPFTKRAGYYEKLTLNNALVSDYTTATGEIGTIYGELNKGRLPYYHRLDINLKRTFTFDEDFFMKVILSVTNVYDRENIFYIDAENNKVVKQLPIMPSLGISLNF